MFAIIPTGLTTKTYTFDLVVSDSEYSVSETFTIKINNAVKLSKTFASDFSGTNGRILVNCTEYFTLNIPDYFTDPDGDTLSYTITRYNGTDLPGWLGITSDYTIGGIPFDNDAEILNILIAVTDSKGSILSVPLTLVVNCKPVDLGKLGHYLYMTS